MFYCNARDDPGDWFWGSRGMNMFAIAYALHERDKEDHNFEITW